MKNYGTLRLILEFTLTDKVTNRLYHTFFLFNDRLVCRHTPTEDHCILSSVYSFPLFI
jgi:hypothetical protein